MLRQGRSSQETMVRTWDRVLVPPQVQFRCSVVSNSATPWTASRQASLSNNNFTSRDTHKIPNKWKTLAIQRRSQFDHLKKLIRRSPEARLKEPEQLLKKLPEATEAEDIKNRWQQYTEVK